MPNDHAVVLSDIHVGNNANTCWYQSNVHEPYLVAACDWIVRNAGNIREVVLLGDLVDIWTYPPSVRPPSMAEIIAANPRTLGPGGALAKVVEAVPKVSFLLGNHDGTLEVADYIALEESVGPIQWAMAVHVLTGASGARTAFSHGHHWTMFNAPDETSRWNTLPVGHFVTRAFSFMMANRLNPGQTVADLANLGYPNGFDLGQFLNSLSFHSKLDIASLLLDYVATVAQMPQTLPIVLPNGDTTTIEEAKSVYAGLFERWVDNADGSVVNAARAAWADNSGDSLAWFAQQLAIKNSADLVVFGHTHAPIGGLTISPTNYYNSGFECATVPDNPPQLFTFTYVDLESASAEIMMVDHGTYEIGVAPVHPMSSVVLWPWQDFSCYVRIINESAEPLRLTGVSAAHGYWPVIPTQTIEPGGRGDGWLQDYPGAEGSEGTFTYTQGDRELRFSVSCPTGLWSNTASSPGNNFAARSGSGDWGWPGSVPWFGHPLQVIFRV